jgi:hypothetical protein
MRNLIASALATATLVSGTLTMPAYAASAADPIVKAQYSYDYGHASNRGRYYDRDGRGWCYAGERPQHCRERLYYERRSGRHYSWYDGRYRDDRYRGDRYYHDRHDDDSGALLAGAIIGFALGAAIVGNQDDRAYYERHRGDRGWADACRRRYDSFDPYSGTYLDRDGYRRYCRV